MDTNEIRAAANSAVMRIGEERERFIKENYPKEDWERISKMCDWLDDIANYQYEERAFEPCAYKGGFYIEFN